VTAVQFVNNLRFACGMRCVYDKRRYIIRNKAIICEEEA